MARPEKIGHDYFPYYTSVNEREYLYDFQKKFNNDGYVVINELDCYIRANGYYVVVDRALGRHLSNRARVSDTKLERIINYALEIDYYDMKLFNEFNILTNKKIQKDHFFTSQRRNCLFVKREYMLLDENDINDSRITRKFALIGNYYDWVNANKNSINVDNNSIFNVNNNSVNVNKNSINVDNNVVNDNDNFAFDKLNKIKENYIKENENSNCNCNSDSKSNSKGDADISQSISNTHELLQTLLIENLVPNDPLNIYLINDTLFALNKEYSKNLVMKAGPAVKENLLKKKDTGEKVFDYSAFISEIIERQVVKITVMDNTKKRLKEELENQLDIQTMEETKNADSVGSEKDELERLKAERRIRKTAIQNS